MTLAVAVEAWDFDNKLHPRRLSLPSLISPVTICGDPWDANRFFVSDRSQIRVVDESTGAVTRLAGHATECRIADGRGGAARFDSIDCMVCTSRSPRRLYCLESGSQRIRMVDVTTGTVSTCAEMINVGSKNRLGATGTGKRMVFYFSINMTDESMMEQTLFIAGGHHIFAYDLAPDRLSLIAVKLAPNQLFAPTTIDCTGAGQLIVSCAYTYSLYAIEPTTGAIEYLVGSGTAGFADGTGTGTGTGASFDLIADVAVVDHERCVYVVDAGNSRIRRVTLPERLFIPPA